MNPPNDVFDPLAREILAVVPGRAHDLARLRVLAQPHAAPTITGTMCVSPSITGSHSGN